jgi:hypothetical protein
MPKANPKKSSRYSQYYRRVKERAITETVKDRAPLYYGLTFTGIVVAIVIVVLALTIPELTKVKAQRGDKVNVTYFGTYASNGTIFDSGTLNDQVIGSNSLLDYFDQQLVGMEPDVAKTFTIPAAFGYQLGQGADHLVGKDLTFEVKIIKLTRDGTILFPKPAT